VTPEELRERTSVWFTEDDQDQPEIPYVGLGTLFWDCGPDWDSAEVVAAFFDLLAALERDCGITLAFADEDQHVEVGPSFAAIYREWHDR
jgi:hypothetical protein